MHGESDERGAAPVEFVLVMIMLIPMFLGILQVGLFLHVRNTMAACAHEGARVGANYDRSTGDGKAAAQECVHDALGAGWLSGGRANFGAGQVNEGGGQMVVVTIDGELPALGQFGPTMHFRVAGHVVKEPPPGAPA